MTAIPSMVPPTAQPASNAASRGSTATLGGGEGVAAAFSAIVAAVTAELASEQALTPETMVPSETLDDTVEANPEIAVVGEVDEVTRSLMAASLLGTGAAPAPTVTPDAVTPDSVISGSGTEPTAEATAAIVSTSVDAPVVGDDPDGATELSTVGAGQTTTDDAAATVDAEPSQDGEGPIAPTGGNGVTRPGGEAAGADAGTESADGTDPAMTDAAVDAVADLTDGGDTIDDVVTGRAPVSSPTNQSVSTEGAAAATAPAPAPTAVGTVTGPPPSEGPVAPALPDQLLEVLAPLRRAPDGTHRMSIQLRPDELGDVQIEFQIRGNEISLNLRADLAGTSDLLRESLAQLRAELDAAGFRSGTLDVADHGDGRAHGDPSDHGRGGDRLAADVPSDDRQNTEPTSAATGLDLRL